MDSFSPIERELLKVAELQVVESQKWEVANECEWPDNLEKEYLDIVAEVERVKREVANTVEPWGWPVYRKYVSGVAGNAISHYELDQLVEKEFGVDVATDSESGTLFIDVTNDKANEVLEFIREHGDNGKFELSDIEKVHGAPRIKGIGNWFDAQRLVNRVENQNV